jgi:addiction module HigA family antidote
MQTLTLETTIDETPRIAPVHPGEIIREEFLIPLDKTSYWLAKGMSVSQTRVQDILNGRRGITADTARRLSRFLGCDPQFWMNLQTHYELELTRDYDATYARLQPREGLEEAA